MRTIVRTFVAVAIATVLGISLPAAAFAFDKVAHRGAGDSTAAQYETAGRAGSILESDLQLTKDNVVVIHHDARLHGRCEGKRISSLSWRHVYACNAKVITLDTLLRTGKKHGVKVWIEFKDNGGKKWTSAHMRMVLRRISAHGMLSRTEIYSFNPSLVTKWRKVDRKHQTKTGLNINTRSRLTVATIKKYGKRAAVKMELLTPSKVASLRKAGLYISVYTVDTNAEMLRAKALKPNAIISDIPF